MHYNNPPLNKPRIHMIQLVYTKYIHKFYKSTYVHYVNLLVKEDLQLNFVW